MDRTTRTSMVAIGGWPIRKWSDRSRSLATNAKGEVYFNDIPNSKAFKIGLDGKVSPFADETKRANGQAFGPDGRLYAVATGANQVVAYDSAGQSTVIADGITGNDLVVRHDGSLYVTHPG